MNQTLYRKYRPHTFDEVIGQDKAVSALTNALKSDKVAHAYVFAGSRGTGKTSVARIFSRALGVSTNDLYEIDAASNRGIDDIRAIKEAVNTLPFDSKYKVYIIDEAHMLTREAWNALLKTLEEPPSHIIFILATTEIEKIPETIMSRCELYNFKKPDQNVLKEVISKTAKKEGYTIEEEASDVLALMADGSFRDAHGALQKIIGSIEGKDITLKNVEEISGVPKSELVNGVIVALDTKDASKIISIVEKIKESNYDAKFFLKMLLEKVRFIILIRISHDFEIKHKEVLNKETFAFLKDFSKKSGSESIINSDMLLGLLDAYEKVTYSSLPYITLEASLLKFLDSKN